MKNKAYSIVAVLVVSIFCLPNFLNAELIETKSDETVRSSQNANTTNTNYTEEKILNPSPHHFLSGLKQVFTSKSNLIYLGTGTAASLIVWPHDDDISEDLTDDNVNEFELQAPTKLGSFYVLAGSSIFTHILGRAIKKPYLANSGLYLIEALLTTRFITFVTKRSLQRTRPDESNNRSFPSGHTSNNFAIASVLDKRYGAKLGIPAYLWASYVGISRIESQKHFPTDVIAGAVLGTIIGRSFVPSKNKNKSFVVSPAFNLGYTAVNFQMNF